MIGWAKVVSDKRLRAEREMRIQAEFMDNRMLAVRYHPTPKAPFVIPNFSVVDVLSQERVLRKTIQFDLRANLVRGAHDTA